MYYLTISGDSLENNGNYKSTINIRSVNTGWSWVNYAEINEIEKKRIEDRFFKEVILKVENQIKTKASS